MSIEWICYDDIFDDSRGHDNEKFDPSTWRDLRMAVVDRVQSSLRSLAANAVGKPLLVTETKHDQTEDVAATVDDFAMAFLHLVDI
ncbi:hypothetical protein DYB25_003317 [Aphanomyces astaci]|uniref:Uncharacterized protein n=1 Tax=Aphanomyces astaci TaxID=112090 RepID=A0A397A9A2_APHAT|nr:hypothetical protein DYB25_003317 [Aphanomyces astaci]